MSKVNYRPVTVFAAINNIYERILVVQLTNLYTPTLSDFISSYRKFHSCETSLLRMREEWRSMRDDGLLVGILCRWICQRPLMLYEHPLLLAKLKAYGLDEDSCALLRDRISSRQQSLKLVTLERIERLRSRLRNLTTNGKPRFAVSGFTLAVCPYLGLKIRGLNSQLPCLFSFVRSLLF